MKVGLDIILIGFMSVVLKSFGLLIYVVVKFGIEGFVFLLCKEFVEKDIKVGLIELGFIGVDF